MKKFLKLLFGRLTIIALAIILQIIVFISLLTGAIEKVHILNIISAVIAGLVFLHVINNDMYPDNKIPWISLILIFPLFGSFAYILFAPNRVPRKQRLLFKKISDKNNNFVNTGLFNGSCTFEGQYEGQSNYVKNVTFYPAYTNTDTKYFSTGEDFYHDLLLELEKAEKFIFMEYFIVERGLMWNNILDVLKKKARQGVDVRFMYDDIGSIGKVPSSYHKTLCNLGIKAIKFSPFRPILTGVHNNRDHRKITVIDGKVGYTGGINLADEYINVNSPYGRWKDSAIKLTGSAVQNLTLMFLVMYNVQKKTVEDFSRYFNQEQPIFENSGFVQPFADGPAPFSPDHVAENVFLNAINQAEKYLYISTPYLIIDHEISNALKLASKRGVDVRIVLPHVPDKKTVSIITKSHYRSLINYGVKIYEYTPGFIHAKNLIADDSVGFVGTVNLDYRSLVHHFECGVLLFNTPSLTDIKTDFEETFKLSELILEKNLKKGFFKTLFAKFLALFAPLL